MKIELSLTGVDLIANARLNKGTAFTEEERDAFELHGLLPPHVGSLDQQLERRMHALEGQSSPFSQYVFLRELQDTNETLFYAMLVRHIEQLLPIVYTPTVGEGCERFSEIWRRPRGLFVSYPNKLRIREMLSHRRLDDVRCIVVSDGERILGLGDQGAGGMGIPIGKMALYTALGGIPPERCLPVLLDVGTDNAERLANPLYVGWRHARVRGAEYDDFVDAFVQEVKRRWPTVLLHWEDFAGANAARLLNRYRNELCTFNDDIQGTAAVASATLISAIQIARVPLIEQRIIMFGFGSAGLGIADLLVAFMCDQGLSRDEALRRFYAIDDRGLISTSRPDLKPEHRPYARPYDERGAIAPWMGGETLLDVVRWAKPTALIGVSGQRGAFTEQAIREMAEHTSRPVIFPLSNPTARSEATPQDLMDWTNGRALIGTGSPFEAAQVGNRKIATTQTNNAYIFPGLALGIIAAQAARVTDAMIMAAAKELVANLPPRDENATSLLPPLSEARRLARLVALAVGREAIRSGCARIGEPELEREVDANIWEPVYEAYAR